MDTNKPTYEELEKHFMEVEVEECVCFLGDVMEHSPFAMWISDKEGTVVKTNNALRKILNLTDKQILGKYNVFKDNNLVEQGVMDQVRAVFEERKSARFRIPWIGAKAGDVDFRGARDLWIDVSMFPIVDMEGYLTNVVCQWISITERKQAEEALKKSEAKYRTIIEGALDGVIVVNSEGRILESNEAYCRMIGYTHGEILEKSLKEIVVDESPGELEKRLKTLWSNGQGRFESKHRRKDGKIIDIDISVRCFDNEKGTTVGFLRDITERKQKEYELRMSEEKYRNLVENMVDVIFTLNAEGVITGINASIKEMLGFEPNDFIGKHFTEWISQDQIPVILSVFKRILSGETIIDETILIGKDGKAHDVEFRATCILKEDKIVGVQGILRDITEQKNAVVALRASESKYRTLVENIPHKIFVKDRGFVYVSCNKSFARDLGIRPDQCAGKTDYDFFPGELAEKYRADDRRIMEAGQTEEMEEKYIQSGQDIWVQTIKTPIRQQDGAVIGILGIFSDITQRKKAEADLQKSEERFKQVVEIAGDWVWEVDTQGLYTYASSVVEPVLGYKPEEIIGKKHFYDFFQPEVKDDLKEAAFEAFRKRECFRSFINPNLHKDGHVVIFETSGTPIIDEEGNFCGYRGVDQDITERTQRENELRELNKNLALASRRAGTAEVATDILHNVGNVLNSINVSAKFIEEKVSNSKVTNLKKVVDILMEHTGDLVMFLTEDERGKHIPLYLMKAAKFILDEQAVVAEKFKSLTKNVEHITHIIKAQQSYARSGRIETETDVQEIIENAMEINYVTLEQYGIDFRYELDEIPRIYVDKQRVLQILVNLITNAKQALLESKEQNKILIIRCYKHGEDKLWIEVTDNGVGISKENIPKLFTHGFTTKKSGHGFGLHGSALAAREIGGSLTAHSDDPGHGATFTLELPLKSEAVTNGCSK